MQSTQHHNNVKNPKTTHTITCTEHKRTFDLQSNQLHCQWNSNLHFHFAKNWIPIFLPLFVIGSPTSFLLIVVWIPNSALYQFPFLFFWVLLIFISLCPPYYTSEKKKISLHHIILKSTHIINQHYQFKPYE